MAHSPRLITFRATLTDTMAGVPNYSLVERKDFSVPSCEALGFDGYSTTSLFRAERRQRLTLMRRVKRYFCISGMRGDVEETPSGGYEFRPHNYNLIIFIEPIPEEKS